MRVGVIGTGAMGSIFGAALARSGVEVLFHDKRAELVASIARDGLMVGGVLGTFQLQPFATTDAAALKPVDWVLVLVDANATADAARAAAGLPTSVSDNVIGVVWSKFVHNCAINPVSAVTGLRPGEIARDPSAARILAMLLDEALALVEKSGVRLPEHDPRAEIYDHTWERFNRPSMLQHIELGRRTEIDALNGALVKRARALGLAAPTNEALALAVKAIESCRAARERSAEVDEATLEAEARANPRQGRWGGV